MKQFITQIVGTNFRGADVVMLLRGLPPGTQLTLVREPDNQYDSNAIKVMYDGTSPIKEERVPTRHLGYVPKTDNEALAYSHDASGGWPKDLTVTLMNKPYILLQWTQLSFKEEN